tara:strand:- start:201 stop:476 length:276 start_codon:yes stop_codon:yes gene_type:complete
MHQGVNAWMYLWMRVRVCMRVRMRVRDLHGSIEPQAAPLPAPPSKPTHDSLTVCAPSIVGSWKQLQPIGPSPLIIKMTDLEKVQPTDPQAI